MSVWVLVTKGVAQKGWDRALVRVILLVQDDGAVLVTVGNLIVTTKRVSIFLR